jgi:hypothetical protein
VPFYVLAFTDARLEPWTIGDRQLQTVSVAGLNAICERRAGRPAANESELREQHALVLAIAGRVGSILPVRFGALLAKRELVELMRRHQTAIQQGLADVCGRVQMTLRVVGTSASTAPVPASTGRQYLEQRLRDSSPTLPAPARRLLEALQPMVIRERREPGAGRLLATVYHLIDAGDVPRYTGIAKNASSPDMMLSGPWPPFAFTPQVW